MPDPPGTPPLEQATDAWGAAVRRASESSSSAVDVLALVDAGASGVGIASRAAVVPGLLQVTPTRAAVVATLLAVLAGIWYVEGRGRWRSLASERLCYGVPWGTLVVVAVVTGFYLLVQDGAWHWDEPLFVPFVTWSYFYPLGTLTAGLAHGSPGHLVGNLATTLVLAPIAEFAWGHYGSGQASSDRGSGDDGDDASASDGAAGSDDGSTVDDASTIDDASADEGTSRSDGGASNADGPPNGDADRTAAGSSRGVLARPWIRAVVLFPAAVLGVSVLTSVLSIGPSLGFSGAVFALAGFALVNYPLATVVGVVVASALRTLFGALSDPVVRGTVETAPPSLPSWAGIAVQAHALGFLLGVLVGLLVLYGRSRRPAPARVFFATLLFGAVQGLWYVVVPGGSEVYVLYRGVGVVLLLLLAGVVTATLAGLRSDDAGATTVPKPDAVRRVALAALVLGTVLLALPAPFVSAFVVDDTGFDDGAAVTAGDYSVAYVENASSPRHLPGDAADEDSLSDRIDGVIVASPERDIWTVSVRQRVLAYDGNATVVVGGVDWRETIDVERPAWDVAGNETVYAVDLYHDGERTRSFASDPATARAAVDGRELVVRPTDDAFSVAVRRDGRAVAEAAIPPAAQSTTLDGLTLETTVDEDAEVVVARTDDVQLVVAERVTYPASS